MAVACLAAVLAAFMALAITCWKPSSWSVSLLDPRGS
jgi:hypothetical protein